MRSKFIKFIRTRKDRQYLKDKHNQFIEGHVDHLFFFFSELMKALSGKQLYSVLQAGNDDFVFNL